MWNLPKGDGFLPSISLAQLQGCYQAEKAAKPKIRLLCAIHRKNNQSLDSICQVSNLKKTTVHDILHRFVERGLKGKDDEIRSGRPSKLSESQRKKLIRRLERGPAYNKSGLWTTKEVKEYVHKEFGVAYTNQHVWEVLKTAGFSIQRPRPRHYLAASKTQQAHFKKRLTGWQRITGR